MKDFAIGREFGVTTLVTTSGNKNNGTWRKLEPANYKKRHSEVSNASPSDGYPGSSIPGIRDLNYLPNSLHESARKQREDVFPRSTHDPTFRWKQNRMSVRNGHVYECIGFPVPFYRTSSIRTIFSSRENQLQLPIIFLPLLRARSRNNDNRYLL